VKIAIIDRIKTFSPIFAEHWKKKHEVTTSSTYVSVSATSDYYDIVYFDWADGNCVEYFTNLNGKKRPKVIVRIRRYEAFDTGKMTKIDWDKVDEIVFNTEFLRNMCHAWYKVDKFKDAHIIPNGVDVSKWNFRERTGGNKIAMLAYWKERKNISMAMQIFALLPPHYEFHLAGRWNDAVSRFLVDDSAMKLGIKNRVFVTDGLVDTDSYLDDKDYLLQTSTSEGVSNIVIESMAKGIKPAIFNSLGQQGLYPRDCMFNHILEAKDIIIDTSAYLSGLYRSYVDERYNRKEMLTKMDALL